MRFIHHTTIDAVHIITLAESDVADESNQVSSQTLSQSSLRDLAGDTLSHQRHTTVTPHALTIRGKRQIIRSYFFPVLFALIAFAPRPRHLLPAAAAANDNGQALFTCKIQVFLPFPGPYQDLHLAHAMHFHLSALPVPLQTHRESD